MQTLDARWQQVFTEYPSLKAANEAQVIRWEWATNQRYDPRPLYFQRHHVRPGKVIQEKTDDQVYVWQYGFDRHNEIVVTRLFGPPIPFVGTQTLETFSVRRGDLVECVRYLKPNLPVEVIHQHFVDGRIAAFRSFSVSVGPMLRATNPQTIHDLAVRTQGIAFCEETYEYQGDRITRIRVTYFRAGRADSLHHEETIQYDSAGRVLTIQGHYADGITQTIYQRAQKEQTISALARLVRRRLLEIIPQVIAKARIEPQVYCLVLHYLDHFSSPTLMLGLESDRQALIREHGSDVRYYLWMPVVPYLEITDPTHFEENALFDQQIALTEQWGRGRAMLRAVAADLMRLRWDGLLNVTPDFVIYAMDYECDDLLDSMAASVPRKQLIEFQLRGWL
jgi:hypothetical protein